VKSASSPLPPLIEGASILIILLGPPGSGKGTHAPALSAELQIPHISTGDLFRDQIRNKTKVGLLAQSYIDQGQLVPDSVVIEMLFSRLESADCQKGAVLDGFPRTISQAEMLEKKFGLSHHWTVLLLKVNEDLLLNRICGRLICQCCSRVFHKIYGPPMEAFVCDGCGGKLYQRSDDQEHLVRERLLAYHKQTAPLIEHYQEIPNVLRVIDASQSKELVMKDILQEFALERV
jgi:adenylate kinase